MDEYARHIKLANEIYVLSRQVDSLMDQTNKFKCDKRQFINPYDVIPYTKYLCLDTKSKKQLTVYPCLFKCCMDALVHSIKYKHSTIKPGKVYYCVQERIDDEEIAFPKLSDEHFYTDDDIKLIKKTTERTVLLMDACIKLYAKHPSVEHGYKVGMIKERDRVKRLLV